MNGMLRIGLGATALCLFATAGVTGAQARTTTTPVASDTCRYALSTDRAVPIKSGPGKKYTTQGWIPGGREKPLFGSCDGTWVQISQGQYAGGWVWAGYLDRI